MGYSEDLKNLLSPLGVYELEAGQNTAELRALGSGFDGCEEIIARLEGESSIITAEDYGLLLYEELMPYIPAYKNLKSRRNAIIALLRIDDASFTVDTLNETLSGCGIKAVVSETDAQYIVEVSFPETRGVPENMDALNLRIKEILPCHLEIQYKYLFFTWDELEGYFRTWDGLEALVPSWDELEIYYAGEEA